MMMGAVVRCRLRGVDAIVPINAPHQRLGLAAGALFVVLGESAL